MLIHQSVSSSAQLSQNHDNFMINSSYFADPRYNRLAFFLLEKGFFFFQSFKQTYCSNISFDKCQIIEYPFQLKQKTVIFPKNMIQTMNKSIYI